MNTFGNETGVYALFIHSSGFLWDTSVWVIKQHIAVIFKHKQIWFL